MTIRQMILGALAVTALIMLPGLASAQTIIAPEGSTVIVTEGNRQIIYAAPRPHRTVEIFPSATRSTVTYHGGVHVHGPNCGHQTTVIHSAPVYHHVPRSTVHFGVGVTQFGSRSAVGFNFGFTEVR